MKKKVLIIFTVLLVLGLTGIWGYKKWGGSPNKITRVNMDHEIGEELDKYNGVSVYFNDHVGNVIGRNLGEDGYNVGLKYQCVEFVKRYYYQKLKHKMPNSYGHAKDFFNTSIEDGGWNEERSLNQYKNGSYLPPKEEDLIIFGPTVLNSYGHVAIVSQVRNGKIEIIQQNPGPYGKSRETFGLAHKEGGWYVDNDRVLGWLRKEAPPEGIAEDSVANP